MEDDWDAVRRLVAELRPEAEISLALTEYHALYTIGAATDAYITTLMGALYLAEVLHLAARSDDLLVANHWSLIENWYFGAIAFDDSRRAAFSLLAAYRKWLIGKLLPVRVSGPTFENAAVGFVPAYYDTPVVSAQVVQDNATMRVFLINRHITNELTVGLSSGNCAPVADVRLHQFASDDYLNGREVEYAPTGTPITWTETALNASSFPIRLTVPPHSIAVVELTVAGGNP